ncbi:ABC transporter permease [Paenibacillus oralis]|uniref:Transport permease protein n=1 Tax=Paenibacillus oralis TaxID=2490856 RepID=A0A3P3TXY5_9BACL|nr:ABC transporter permease [Paenibacillus oralis]RRJ62209.1 ABC transporter permease [Paenibacillus oralis]
MNYLKENLQTNYRLLFDLSKNDFNKRFKGSYFGIFWAFVNPLITVLLYWFVFEIGFRTGSTPEGYPFILWLICGMVPWFFFSEAFMNATLCFSEYSFLVKKVVFQIGILPFIKIFSALFIHIFFVAFLIIILLCYGVTPTLSWFQLFYYLFCTMILLVGTSFITASILPFFKDIAQIVSIIVQIGFWLTPIVWTLDIVPLKYRLLFKLNPFYYIAEGYRDTFLNNYWFWNKPFESLYFLGCCSAILFVGIVLFKKLKPHFSDVL